MKIEILGPLNATYQDVDIPVHGRRECLILSALAVAERTLPVEDLIDALWPDDPPTTARKQVQNCTRRVARRLRHIIGHDVVERRGLGYRLVRGAVSVDAVAYTQAVCRAQQAESAGDLATAVGEYRHGLALWRGDLAFGAEPGWLHAVAVGLTESRWAAYENCVRLEQRLGLGPAHLAELHAVVARFPQREGLVATLSDGLVAVGRTVEALELFDRTRLHLADEYGMTPGPQLRAAHLRALRV